MRQFGRGTKTLLVLLSVGVALAVGAPASGQRPPILRWATFPAGSLNHVMTSGMASVVDTQMKSSSRVASYTGYRDYVPLIDKGETDFGILNALDAWGAYHGNAPFYQAKHRNLRLVRSAPAGKVAVLVRAVSEPRLAGAVGVHDIDLEVAVAARHERYISSVRRPGGREVGTEFFGEGSDDRVLCIDDVDVGFWKLDER